MKRMASVRLRVWRERKGLKQAALAERLSISQGALSHLEDEDGSDLPSLALAVRIERATGIAPRAWIPR